MYQLRKTCVVMDIECYINYFLVSFRDIENPERTKRFEMRYDKSTLDVEGIKKMLRGATIITFNGNNYDMPMLMYALNGAKCSELKAASNEIIEGNIKPWQFQKEYDCPTYGYVDHVDIFNIPVGTLSLKAYSARIACKKLQDLPIDPEEWLTEDQMNLIADYCDNDTANTRSLFLYPDVKSRVDLRCDISDKYGKDWRSKSDAQLGEALLKTTIERKTGRVLKAPEFHTVPKRFKYDIPDYIYFSTPELKELLQILEKTVFKVGQYGHVIMPDELSSLKLRIFEGLYTLGIGGLHSNESSRAVVAKEGQFIIDADVGSYYPSLIINGGYYPAHLGELFLNTFRYFRDTRLTLKDFISYCKKYGVDAAMEKYGNEEWVNLPEKEKIVIIETYKIVLNGTFGKLASMYSFVYSPKMMLQVTLTGQLCLLMLIERIESAGMKVISANTDGIVIHGINPQRKKLDHIIQTWEIETGLIMEYTEYSAVYSQSVNDYLALKPEGKFKRKGAYAARGIGQTGNGQVCIEAVMEYLKNGTDIRTSIMACDDFIKFTNFQQVTGGAYKDGEYLGKVVRWYYSTGTNTAILNKRGNMVPLTKGAMPCMELPDETPDDIDHNWYIREAHDMLDRLGVKNVPKEKEAFGLVEGEAPAWGRKLGQQTWHLIDLSTKDAMCEARLKDRHEEWEFHTDGNAPTTGRLCGKCKKKV